MFFGTVEWKYSYFDDGLDRKPQVYVGAIIQRHVGSVFTYHGVRADMSLSTRRISVWVKKLNVRTTCICAQFYFDQITVKE